MLSIENELKKLPILPSKVSKLLNLENNKNYDTKKLLEIIHSDAILTSKILNLANSKLFGFSNYIDSPRQALALYGINFTLSMCIVELINNSVRFNLSAYGINKEKYLALCDFSYKIISNWIEEKEASLKESLIIPLYLSNLGNFLISDYLEKENKTKEFKQICKDINICKAQKDFAGINAFELSAIILKKWGFNTKIRNMIFYMDNAELAREDKKAIFILDVIKTASSFEDPFSKENIHNALRKAFEYELDSNKLKDILNKNKFIYT